MHDQAGASFLFGPYELDPVEQRLLRQGLVVPLTPKAFDLLRVLVESSGRLVRKDDLIRQVWPDTFVDEANLSRVVSVLRATLADGDSTARYIETVPKRGYRFVAPVLRARQSSSSDMAAPRSRPVPLVALTGAVVAGLAAVVYLSLGAPVPASRPSIDAVGAGPAHRQLTLTGRESWPALSPDGSHIAYVSGASPDSQLMVQDLSSGQSVMAFRAPEISNLRWSPDGRELLLFARQLDLSGGIHTVPRSGGAVRTIANGMFKACWSPDGSRIAVGVFGRGQILLVDPHGAQQIVPLAGDHGWIWDIDWSAALDRLLILSNDTAGTYRLWTVRPDGTDQQLLHEERVELRAARWAADGATVYFSRRDDQTVTFFKLAIGRGTPPTPLPLLSGLETSGAFSVSSDGRRIAYARAPFHSNLWTIRLPRSPSESPIVKTQLTHGTTLVERPRISPDGRLVLFNRGYDGRSDLFTVAIAGGTPRQLTFLNAFSVGGSWSPDGAEIAFASNEGGRTRPWAMRADGTLLRALSDGPVSDSYAVAWLSPSRLLYQQPDNHDFAIVDTAPHRASETWLGSSSGWTFSPERAPDGRHVAFSWNDRGRHGVWLLDLATRRKVRILDGAADPIGWSADGRTLYAVQARPGLHRGLAAVLGETTTETRVIAVPIDGGPPRDVLRLPFEEVGGVSISADGRTIVCAVYSSRSDVWIVEHFDGSTAPVKLE